MLAASTARMLILNIIVCFFIILYMPAFLLLYMNDIRGLGCG